MNVVLPRKKLHFFLVHFQSIFPHTNFASEYGGRQKPEIVKCDMGVRSRWTCGESGFVWA